jgi:hypothetical protein
LYGDNYTKENTARQRLKKWEKERKRKVKKTVEMSP